MPQYELRLTLPDHPGAFGAAATSLGHVGANILSFEAVETAEGVAVDQLLLDVDASNADQVPAALESLPGVEVELFRPVPQRPAFDGPLELIESLIRVSPDQVLQTLADGVPITLRASWAAVVTDRRPQPRLLAASVGAPSLVGATTPWLPLTRAQALSVEEWVPDRWDLRDGQAFIAAAPMDDTGDSALLAVRKPGPAFRSREIRVLAALAIIAGHLSRTVAKP